MGIRAVGPLSKGVCTLAGDGLTADLADMLHQSNGFAMWGGAFVVLPSGSDAAVPGIETYNGEWKNWYSNAVRETTFFALDVFGFPFGIEEGKVVQLDPETGVLTPVAETLGGLIERVEAEPDATIGCPCSTPGAATAVKWRLVGAWRRRCRSFSAAARRSTICTRPTSWSVPLSMRTSILRSRICLMARGSN